MLNDQQQINKETLTTLDRDSESFMCHIHIKLNVELWHLINTTNGNGKKVRGFWRASTNICKQIILIN